MNITLKTMTLIGMVGLLALAVTVGCDRGGDQKTTVKGPTGQKLTLQSPSDVTLQRGATADVAVTIKRKELTDKVSIRFSDLPAGVSVVNPDKNLVGDEATFRLQASESADLVSNHQVKVTAKADESDIAATESFRITVEEDD